MPSYTRQPPGSARDAKHPAGRGSNPRSLLGSGACVDPLPYCHRAALRCVPAIQPGPGSRGRPCARRGAAVPFWIDTAARRTGRCHRPAATDRARIPRRAVSRALATRGAPPARIAGPWAASRTPSPAMRRGCAAPPHTEPSASARAL